MSERDLPAAQILVVDDEPEHAEVMAEALRRQGHVCTIVHDLASAQEELRHGVFDLVVTDLMLNPADANDPQGMAVLAAARQTQRNAETIMVTAHGDVPTCKAALQQGAFDFIEKPLDLAELRVRASKALEAVMLRSQNDALRSQVDERYGLEGIVGQSAAIGRVLATLRQVAPSDIAVLITGESGTGKELVARALLANSNRAKKQFKPVNCAGLTESILESELFGHVKGAFTGAERDRQGVFEYADGGTLFLDEIGDMPLGMQAKLLRVLENGEVVRVGSNDPRHVDVRLISATNHDLPQLIKEGRFREDLYYRIRGAHVHLPPLRERREDIPLLARHYLGHYSRQLRKDALLIEDDAVLALMRYDWPGNVRQLMNVMQNMVLVATAGKLTLHEVPLEIRQSPGGAQGAPAAGLDAAGAGALGSLAGMTLDQIEKQAIRNALRLNQGNREATAKMLNIGERTLYRKLREYGIK